MNTEKTLQEKLENKTFEVTKKEVASEGIKHFEKTVKWGELSKALNFTTDLRTSSDLQSNHVQTRLTAVGLIDDFAIFSDSNLGNNKVRVFTNQIQGNNQGTVTTLGVPETTVSASFIEESCIYVCAGVDGNAFLHKEGEDSHDFGTVFATGYDKPVFKIRASTVAYISGHNSVTFVSKASFQPLETQTFSFISDIPVAQGILDIFVISSTEFVVVGTRGEVLVYSQTGDLRSEAKIPLTDGKIIVTGADVSTDGRYVIISSFNVVSKIPELFLLEIDEDLEVTFKQQFAAPGEFGGPLVESAFGAINFGLNIGGNSVVVATVKKGKYDKETRLFTGRLLAFGINDAGNLEKIKEIEIPYRYSNSLISNG